MKTSLKQFFTALCVSLFSFSCLVACGEKEETSSPSSSSEQQVDKDIYGIYELAKAAGETKSYDEWLASIKGDKGDPGIGVKDVALKETKDGFDFYTITLTDGTTKEFKIKVPKDGTDGAPGKDGADGVDGAPGKDGADGADGVDGKDGISITGIEKTKHDGLKDTYTLTFSDGTTFDFVVTNGTDGAPGKDGADGQNGSDGKPGSNGEDGHTPKIEIGENGNWFVDGVDTKKKAQGEKGDPGVAPSTFEDYKAMFGYAGTYDEWIKDLAAGQLGTKKQHYVEVYYYYSRNSGEDNNTFNKLSGKVYKNGEKINITIPDIPEYDYAYAVNSMNPFVEYERYININDYRAYQDDQIILMFEPRRLQIFPAGSDPRDPEFHHGDIKTPTNTIKIDAYYGTYSNFHKITTDELLKLNVISETGKVKFDAKNATLIANENCKGESVKFIYKTPSGNLDIEHHYILFNYTANYKFDRVRPFVKLETGTYYDLKIESMYRNETGLNSVPYKFNVKLQNNSGIIKYYKDYSMYEAIKPGDDIIQIYNEEGVLVASAPIKVYAKGTVPFVEYFKFERLGDDCPHYDPGKPDKPQPDPNMNYGVVGEKIIGYIKDPEKENTSYSLYSYDIQVFDDNDNLVGKDVYTLEDEYGDFGLRFKKKGTYKIRAINNYDYAEGMITISGAQIYEIKSNKLVVNKPCPLPIYKYDQKEEGYGKPELVTNYNNLVFTVMKDNQILDQTKYVLDKANRTILFKETGNYTITCEDNYGFGTTDVYVNEDMPNPNPGLHHGLNVKPKNHISNPIEFVYFNPELEKLDVSKLDIQLYKLDGKPEGTLVQIEPIVKDNSTFILMISEPGEYRLTYELKGKDSGEVKFTVIEDINPEPIEEPGLNFNKESFVGQKVAFVYLDDNLSPIKFNALTIKVFDKNNASLNPNITYSEDNYEAYITFDAKGIYNIKVFGTDGKLLEERKINILEDNSNPGYIPDLDITIANHGKLVTNQPFELIVLDKQYGETVPQEMVEIAVLDSNGNKADAKVNGFIITIPKSGLYIIQASVDGKVYGEREIEVLEPQQI